jgi:phosphopantetheine--protein transferase-like protein
MEATIKEIVSVFIKIPAEQIGPSTPIGRTAVKSSILLHRMYAKLSEQGVRVENYAEVLVFGDLLRSAAPSPSNGNGLSESMSAGTGSSAENGHVAATGPAVTYNEPVNMPVPADLPGTGIGLDIEEIAALPKTHDFRKESFYTQNFTAGEIAYCILQADPYASFAGLFAVKEAIVKAEGRYRTRPFNTIEIGHSPEGRPVHAGFQLSISHAGNMAVAVASPVTQTGPYLREEASVPMPRAGKPSSVSPLVWIALLMSLIALILVIRQTFS